MANIQKKANQLQQKYRIHLTGAILSYGGVFLFWMLHLPLKNPAITMPGFVICGILAGYFSKQFKIVQSGLKGEKSTIHILSNLPDNFYVFNDIKVEAEGRTSQIDNIVVSPHGVFIVETKNHNGEIMGEVEDKYWTQYKVGRKGTPYEKSLYNPIKQVKTHTWRLKQFFKENGIDVWIDSAVYFSNPEAEVVINTDFSPVPVFDYQDSSNLLDYVSKAKKKNLSEQDIKKVVSLLQILSKKAS